MQGSRVVCIVLQTNEFDLIPIAIKKRWTIPPSDLVTKINAIPEKAVGIPMTKPEKVAEPPRSSAYTLADEMMTKNENWTCISSGNFYTDVANYVPGIKHFPQ